VFLIDLNNMLTGLLVVRVIDVDGWIVIMLSKQILSDDIVWFV
jgi:hypothetical protein